MSRGREQPREHAWNDDPNLGTEGGAVHGAFIESLSGYENHPAGPERDTMKQSAELIAGNPYVRGLSDGFVTLKGWPRPPRATQDRLGS
jgi:hypothetical protein